MNAMIVHRMILSAASVASVLFISFGFDMVYCQVCQMTSPLQQSLDGLGVTVSCDTVFEPVDCDFKKIPLLKVEDFERCGPLKLNLTVRNYMLGAAGRRITYNENKAAYKRIRIIPKMLRDVSNYSLGISTLGQNFSFPIGLSPAALQKLFHPEGEAATARAMTDMGIAMTLSSAATSTIEEVANHARGGSSHLWMQTYIFKNRSWTVDIVSRAEKAGYEAVVVTVDSPIGGASICSQLVVVANPQLATIPRGEDSNNVLDKSVTFKDLSWLKSITKLPIIVKGILSARDARLAISAGASAIFVSNQGGRQMDNAPATIDVLPRIVDAVHKINPDIDVYVDGGIRNGLDVYKAIASGAKMAFVGRPQIYGLAMEGEDGVRKVLNILRTEFEEAMLLSGASHPSKICRNTLVRTSTCGAKNDDYFCPGKF